MTTAAALIIGDELLAGRVRDENGPRLVACLAGLGVRLRRLVVLGDDEAAIAEELARLAPDHDVIVTSGGIGPTHDDRTVAATARAFGVRVVRDPELERLIRSLWGRRFTEAALRMADVPEGARLLWGEDGLLPLVVFRNVYLLPGIPSLFSAKLGTLRRELSGTPPVLARIFLRADESRIAPLLGRIAAARPEVRIGSYPHLHGAGHTLLVTVEGEAPEPVTAATDEVLRGLPAGAVVRVERP